MNDEKRDDRHISIHATTPVVGSELTFGSVTDKISAIVLKRKTPIWWFIGFAEVTVFVQVVLGALLVGREKVPLPEFHAFYGFVAIIAIAIIYSYRFQLKHRLYLLYGFGSLFVMGLAIRAMLVAA